MERALWWCLYIILQYKHKMMKWRAAMLQWWSKKQKQWISKHFNILNKPALSRSTYLTDKSNIALNRMNESVKNRIILYIYVIKTKMGDWRNLHCTPFFLKLISNFFRSSPRRRDNYCLELRRRSRLRDELGKDHDWETLYRPNIRRQEE